MPSLNYKILSHTADLRLEVYGKTIEELFKNAATAFADILFPKTKNLRQRRISLRLKKLKIEIHLKSANLNTLLVDFLNEILAKSNINKAVYELMSLRVDEDKIKVEAELVGIPVTKFEEDVKAVTYHEVQINQQPTTNNKQQKRWSTKLVFDI